jgi:FkbM family methyltransferase
MTAAEFAYTVLLRPRPLKAAANHILRLCIPPRLHLRDVTVVLNPKDPVVSGALTLGVYEKAETRVFRAIARPGMTFVDIGANVGYYTALAMGLLGRSGRIVALEPDAESFSYLRQTVAANRGAGVTCVNQAAAAERGSMRLFTSSDNRGDSRLYDNDLATDSCVVPVIKLDDLMEELNVPEVHLVKMDVQGFEGHVLRGMRRTIEHSPSLVLLTEFWPHGLSAAGSDPGEVLRDLVDMGLRLYRVTAQGGLNPLDDHQDLIRSHSGRKYTNIVATRTTSRIESLLENA